MTMFSELALVPALAETIAARGYETATPVQVAVLDAKVQGRDLLVSSQTGSGKTLAFGSLIAQALLEQTEAAEDPHVAATAPAHGRSPRALIIAPTRELATQVRAELSWLLARVPLQVAAFTGGSDIGRDFKSLRAGTDVVVGTPGRLVDLLSRKALRLEAIKVVVLDEADEMLDMGFHEDLETILGAATARARTHMFSATLPRPILALAAGYQKDASRIDAKTLGEGSSHEDIRHVAHLVAMGDRGKAVINVLRNNPDERAIVFGTTREGVADLHRELLRQGFRAVVLSGDRAQAERNRALAALRAGEAQILVATNVAARGLDLPEVDLVVHADLPLNAEALTHRSGRTGRAGRKGTSVLIANLAERRKAERLLSCARVEFSWTNAPGAKEIRVLSEKRLEDTLRTEAAGEPSAAVQAMAERLGQNIVKDRLLFLLLERELQRMPKGEEPQPVDARMPKGSDRFRADGRPPVSRAEFSHDAVVFRVNLGQESRAEPGWLLPLICRRGGVTRREVGAIRVLADHSEFEISGDAAKDFALAAAQTDPRAPHVHMELATAGHAHRPAPAAPAKPVRRPSAETRKPPLAAVPDFATALGVAECEIEQQGYAPPKRKHTASKPGPGHEHPAGKTTVPSRFEHRAGSARPSSQGPAKGTWRRHPARPQASFGRFPREETSGSPARDRLHPRPTRPGVAAGAPKSKWHSKPGKGPTR